MSGPQVTDTKALNRKNVLKHERLFKPVLNLQNGSHKTVQPSNRYEIHPSAIRNGGKTVKVEGL